ncbi:MAG: hypothetical protein EAZ07_00915 [Cytophagales bacterium]|nr:MAG: hypothetical protein EAZ07_00915 [Cytophagales bacterium]
MELPTKKQTGIQWSQIASLAALNAAVVFSWIAYNNYQPKILEKFQLQELTIFLAFAQTLVMVLIPPLAGLLGDYMIKKNSNRFLIFTIGISITAMVFMAVAFTVSGHLFESWKSMLPILILIWLISMNIFISPANSMIELFAPTKQLPIVMGVLVMVTEIVAALEPSIIVLIDTLGPTSTFVGGGILIAVTGYSFKKSTNNIIHRNADDSNNNSKNNFGKIILVGLLLGAITGIIMNIFPTLLEQKLIDIKIISKNAPYLVSLLLIIAAILALPFSKWVEQNGTPKGIIIGLLGAIALTILIFMTSGWICLVACLGLAAFYSLASVSAFPYALQNLNVKDVAYGTGIFIGSTELIDQLINVYGIL